MHGVGRMRLTLEKYIQQIQERIFEDLPRLINDPYHVQLENVAKAYDYAHPLPSDKCVSTLIRNIAKGKQDAVFKLSEQFGKHLYDTDLNIPVSVLPRPSERQTFYVQFPKGISFEYKGCAFDNFIIDVGPINVLSDQNHSKNLLAYRFYSLEENNPNWMTEGRQIPSVLMGSTTLEGSVSEAIKSLENPSVPKDMLAYGFKLLLYINSGEPDLTPEMPRYPQYKNKEKFLRHIENHCPFKVVNIGYSFHGKHYHIDASSRRGHFRWQPHGPGLSQVKLIWINETTVNYRKG